MKLDNIIFTSTILDYDQYIITCNYLSVLYKDSVTYKKLIFKIIK